MFRSIILSWLEWCLKRYNKSFDDDYILIKSDYMYPFLVKVSLKKEGEAEKEYLIRHFQGGLADEALAEATLKITKGQIFDYISFESLANLSRCQYTFKK